MRPKVSVILPTYNRCQLLAFAIQSIFDQSFKDWELIVIDDGSTDETTKLLTECSKLEPRLRFVTLEHKGLVSALHVGNEMAQADLIVKQDSDDLSLPNRLERVYKEWKKTKADFIYHGMYQVFYDKTGRMRKIYISAQKISDRILKEQYISGAFSYTKEFITENPYRMLECSEDWMLIMDAYLRGKKIAMINEGLYDYAMRNDSNSKLGEKNGAYVRDEKKMRDILKKEYNINSFNYPNLKGRK